VCAEENERFGIEGFDMSNLLFRPWLSPDPAVGA
jgi:hypothetical protein